MAYQGRSNQQARGQKTYGGKSAAKATGPISEQVYFCSVKLGDDEFLTVANISKYTDSGKMTLSLNHEAIKQLEVNERGWINNIYVNEAKPFVAK